MEKKIVAIYARVSTNKQDISMQLDELKEYVKRRGWTLGQTYQDKGFTGSNTRRPEFNNLMAEARQRKFDILLVWKLDRFCRSLKDLIVTIDELENLNIDFVSYKDTQFDTTSPSGRLVFNIIGSVAEFEREIIRERVIAGLDKAKRKGKTLGRKKKLSSALLDKAKKMRGQGLTWKAIGKKLDLNESTIRKKLKNVI